MAIVWLNPLMMVEELEDDYGVEIEEDYLTSGNELGVNHRAQSMKNKRNLRGFHQWSIEAKGRFT